MRPLRLEVAAFGPYAEREVLDYGELGGHTLFLLHGPTGAGKTSILDAICFALYGESSGGERDAGGMRSHKAAPGTPTEVTFDFAVGVERYRVRRRPAQLRPRARGEGFTTDQADATLWRRTDCAADDDPGEPRGHGVRGVNAEIERILGFGAAQFRQVVVLPQGKFRDFLIARSDEREKILATLFDTDRFARLQNRLREEAAEALRQAEPLRERRAGYLEQAESASIDELHGRVAALAEQAVTGEAAVAAARSTRDTSAEAEAEGRRLADAFNEHAGARAHLNALEQRQGEMDVLRRELARAATAEPLRPVEEAWTGQRAAAQRAGSAAETAAGRLASAHQRRDSAAVSLAAEHERGPEREQAQRAVAELAGLAEAAGALASGREELESARKTEKQSSDACDRAAGALAAVRATADTASRGAERLRASSAQLEGFEAELREAERRVVARGHLRDASMEVEKLEAELERASALRVEAEAEYVGAAAEEDTVRREWIRGQAARLAQHLATGEPCPVCGSAKHPHPASASDNLPDDDAVEAARELAARRATAAQKATVTQTASEGRLKAAAGLMAARVEELGPLADAALDELTSVAAALKEQVAQSAAARVALPTADREAAEAQEAATRAGTDAEEAQRTHAAAVTAVSRAAAVLAERERHVPEVYREPAALATAQAEAEHRLDDLVRMWTAAQDEHREAALQVASAEAEVAATATAAAAAVDEARDAEERFRAALVNAGFSDEDVWRAAQRPPERRASMGAEVTEHDASLADARTRAGMAAAAVAEKEAPDLLALQDALARAAQAHEDAVSRHRSTADLLARLQGLVAELDRVAAEVEAAEALYQEIGRVAEVASGQNNHKLPFQRYVLGALLDEVLEQATARLHLMSRGRYELLRAAGPQGRSRTGGLDLEVMDHHTGVPRPTTSLSGGESFLASLSLALGLADVVQSHHGGRHLETIFVDEGFGTLDPESLDLAMRALVDLQSAGRLVGIISHVPELRQLIPARLEVVSGPAGSRAQFHTN